MKIRLRRIQIDKDLIFAYQWYNNPRVLIGSEGKHVSGYDLTTIKRMYTHLNTIGHVYIIEVYVNNHWHPIGDVTLSKTMNPIVIGDDQFHHKGIGKRVILLLIHLAEFYQFKHLNVNKVFEYNIASQKLFESMGFIKTSEKLDDNGEKYFQYHINLEEHNEGIISD
ncbi:GNAT family N-acetyltransferase [Macrococcus sp. DPC7161]|uniref:GNAT family N-acetyltransferase n=1 Tax=Macrococcus sp. DPC7161 TaxID=2507060 RepID=UPI00100BD41C|nr:GNAT family N-acetyltransferase [Macrococcus sp. DPC7161]RXK19173.1 N-acetyltransferase [Macrococcus sp. DPC7161]